MLIIAYFKDFACNKKVPKKSKLKLRVCSFFRLLFFTLFLFNSPLVVKTSLAESSLAKTNYHEQNKLQAVYIYNFLKFINWPKDNSPVNSKNYEVCIVGEDPFGPILDLLKTKKVNNKSIHVQYFSTAKAIKNCHLVFISHMHNQSSSQLIKMPNSRGILTVSTDKRFAAQGGIIAFVIENNRVRFNINNSMAKERGLEINSKLLELALTVF